MKAQTEIKGHSSEPTADSTAEPTESVIEPLKPTESIQSTESATESTVNTPTDSSSASQVLLDLLQYK